MSSTVLSRFVRRAAVLGLALLGLSGCGSAVSESTHTSSTVARGGATSSATSASRTSTSWASSTAAGQLAGIVGRSVGSRCVFGLARSAHCANGPVQAAIVVLAVGSRRPVAMVRSDPAGRFRVRLSPGAYQLIAQPGDQLLFSRTIAVRVRAGRLAHLTVLFYRRHPLPVRSP